MKDSGLSNQRLETLGEGLQRGTPAVVTVVEHTRITQVEEALAAAEADVITAEIQADIAAQLEAGHEVAYSAIASQEGISLDRVAGGEDEVDARSLVIDDTGVYGGRFLATEDGFAVKEMAITDEGIEDVLIVAALVDEETDSEG